MADKIIQTSSMGGVRYEVHKVDKFLTCPLYYAILKFNNGDEVQTLKSHYLSECHDHIRTAIAEEGFYA